MKTSHQLLITYTLTPGQLQKITEVSSLIDVHYAPTLEEGKKQFSSAEILFGDIPRDQFLLMPQLRWYKSRRSGRTVFYTRNY